MLPDNCDQQVQLRNLIDLLVTAFYKKAVTDPFLKYQFQKIHDFDDHFDRILLFWKLHLLRPNEDEMEKIRVQKIGSNLIALHRELNIKSGELGRWLLLFRQTIEDYAEKNSLNEEEIVMLVNWQQKLDHFETHFKALLFVAPA